MCELLQIYKFLPTKSRTGIEGREYLLNLMKLFCLMFRFLSGFGSYWMLLGKVFSRPEKTQIYYKQTVKEIISLGIRSIGIVTIISFFMGAVITLQTAYNTENPIYPTYLIGLGCRDSILLEFSSTIVALILAGKVGSNIASEIGTMRVTEQIDALELMGVNSASYLILPKIVATLVFNPASHTYKHYCRNSRRMDRRNSFRRDHFTGLYLRNSVFIYSLLCHLRINQDPLLCFHNNFNISISGLLC